MSSSLAILLNIGSIGWFSSRSARLDAMGIVSVVLVVDDDVVVGSVVGGAVVVSGVVIINLPGSMVVALVIS